MSSSSGAYKSVMGPLRNSAYCANGQGGKRDSPGAPGFII